ncbi:MAG: hypothetical protein HY291_07420 [Planctomycetes bacterium]|nr:hypothetical protein [Planctomycetota bacterium]
MSLVVGLHAGMFAVGAFVYWGGCSLEQPREPAVVADVLLDAERAEFVPESAGYRGSAGGSSSGQEVGRPAAARVSNSDRAAAFPDERSTEVNAGPSAHASEQEGRTADGSMVRVPSVRNTARAAGRAVSGDAADGPLSGGGSGSGLGGAGGGEGSGFGGSGGGGQGTGTGGGSGNGKGKGTGNGQGDGWDALANSFGRADGGRAAIRLPGKPDYPHSCRAGTCKGGVPCQGVGRWRIYAEKAGATPVKVELLKSAGCSLLDASTRKFLMNSVIPEAGTFELNIRFQIEDE